jgi:hypothetical protein
MSDFKTGDRIAVADMSEDGFVRLFLAEYDGMTYYLYVGTGETFHVQTCDVSAYVPPAPPFPFKVGDRICPNWAATEHIVVAVSGTTAHLAYYDNGVVRPVNIDVRGGEAWKLVPSAEPAHTYTHEGVVYDLNAAYRDCEGDVWRFTGSVTANNTPGMECAEGPTKEPLDTVVDIWGPLTRV